MRDRVADLAARRKAMMEQIGDKGILILYAAEPRNYAGDVDWPFRQENNFFYLTGIEQTGNALVLIPGAAQVPRDPVHGAVESRRRRVGPATSCCPMRRARFPASTTIWDARLLPQFLTTLMPDAKSVFMPENAARGGRGGRWTAAEDAAWPPPPRLRWTIGAPSSSRPSI